jgi:hypothetical protein
VVADTDELYTVLQLATRTGFGLSVSTDIALTDGTVLDHSYNFTILATAQGLSVPTASKEVYLQIDICGSETITLVDATDFSSTLDIDPAAIATEVDLTAMFTTDDEYCPPVTYALKTDDTTFPEASDPSADQLLNFNSADGTMSLFPQTEDEHTFFIYAVTVSGAQATKPA